MENIVVTGLGAITPLGLTMEETWANLLAGQSGITRSKYLTDPEIPCQLGGDIRGFNPKGHFSAKEADRTDPHILWAMVSARAALADARLDPRSINPSRGGVITAVGSFGVRTIVNVFDTYTAGGHVALRPHHMGNSISSTAAGLLCIETGFKGFSMNLQTACASANTAVGLAIGLLQSGAYDVIMITGAEAPVSNPTQAAWCSMAAMAMQYNDTPEKAVRPFDEDRDGLVMSEIGATLILETERHARARGRKPYARVAGFGQSNDAYHPFAPATEGQVLAINAALASADIEASDIAYINAHGTGTFLGDQVEAETLRVVFGEGARGPRIGATKALTGHAMGATGALEMGILALAHRDRRVPPNRNLLKPIAELNFVGTEAEPLQADKRHTMSLTFGFGGNNAVVIFEDVE